MSPPLILIVDDHDYARKALARELGSDFELVEAASYQEAVEALERAPASAVRAVVSDCYMGDGPSGLDLLAHVRDSAPNAVRVLVSGSLEEADFGVHLNDGLLHAYFAKPWRYSDLRRKLVGLVEG